MKKNERGSVLLAAAFILAIVVVGMIILAKQHGVDIVQQAQTVGQTCRDVVYNSGVVEHICQ